jgi:hypothetical protein
MYIFRISTAKILVSLDNAEKLNTVNVGNGMDKVTLYLYSVFQIRKTLTPYGIFFLC